MDPIFKGRKDAEFFELDDFEACQEYLKQFSQDEPLEIIIRKPIRLGSNAQMRYYFGVVVKLISDYTGHTPDEIDSLLKWKFLQKVDAKGLSYVPSKTALSTKEFTDYIESIRVWALISLELDIPAPNEVDYGQGPVP